MEDLKWILKRFYADAHITSDRQLCSRTGMDYSTFRKRMRYPSTMRLFELELINDALNIPDEGLLEIVKSVITPKSKRKSK